MANTDSSAEQSSSRIKTLGKVPVRLTAVLGRTRMRVEDLLSLSSGSVIELDRKIGEPVDVMVNDRLVARGELVIIDETVGLSIIEIIKRDE